ncbi:MAG: hypothetical protein WDZ42_02165 [Candidatus Saccharimonadales bacterium]
MPLPLTDLRSQMSLKRQTLRGFISLGLALSLLLLVRADLVLLAALLAAASKWQLMLGGPKLWLFNIWDNATDIVVLVGYIVLLVIYSIDPTLQWSMMVVYLFWQIVIKPLSGVGGKGLQALFALGIGVGTVFLLKSTLGTGGVMILSWVIGYISASHFLSGSDDNVRRLLPLIWALIVSQFAWIMSHWLIFYPLFNGRLLIPQAVVILVPLAYIFGNIYYDHLNRRLKKKRLFGYLGIMAFILLVVISGSEWAIEI